MRLNLGKSARASEGARISIVSFLLYIYVYLCFIYRSVAYTPILRMGAFAAPRLFTSSPPQIISLEPPSPRRVEPTLLHSR